MRCPSCGHINTAERLFCARCAAELVPEMTEQFEPPRARTRRRRQAREAVQTIHTGIERFNAIGDKAEVSVRSRDPAELHRGLRRSALLLAAVVPGLSHLLQGEKRLGRRLLLLAGVSLGTWLGFMGSFLGTTGVFSLASLAVTSVADAARLQPKGPRLPLRPRHLLLGLSLMFLCWMLGTQLLAWGWERLTVNIPIRVVGLLGEEGVLFHKGDRVLVFKHAYLQSGPQRGDIIYITAEVGGDTPALERVIGVPGDEVVFKGGKLTVNGQAVPADQYPLQPVDPVRRGHEGGLVHTRFDVKSWSGVMSKDRYLVWGVELPQGHDMEAIPAVGPRQIHRTQIGGKGWLLYSPYTHRRVL